MECSVSRSIPAARSRTTRLPRSEICRSVSHDEYETLSRTPHLSQQERTQRLVVERADHVGARHIYSTRHASSSTHHACVCARTRTQHHRSRACDRADKVMRRHLLRAACTSAHTRARTAASTPTSHHNTTLAAHYVITRTSIAQRGSAAACLDTRPRALPPPSPAALCVCVVCHAVHDHSTHTLVSTRTQQRDHAARLANQRVQTLVGCCHTLYRTEGRCSRTHAQRQTYHSSTVNTSHQQLIDLCMLISTQCCRHSDCHSNGAR
jgi:hypothetical protein